MVYFNLQKRSSFYFTSWHQKQSKKQYWQLNIKKKFPSLDSPNPSDSPLWHCWVCHNTIGVHVTTIDDNVVTETLSSSNIGFILKKSNIFLLVILICIIYQYLMMSSKRWALFIICSMVIVHIWCCSIFISTQMFSRSLLNCPRLVHILNFF